MFDYNIVIPLLDRGKSKLFTFHELRLRGSLIPHAEMESMHRAANIVCLEGDGRAASWSSSQN